MAKDPKNSVKEMIALVGRPKAERLLVAANLSPSMAYKLVRGTYKSEIGFFYAAAIERARLAAETVARAG